jgi:hypothetical protein
MEETTGVCPEISPASSEARQPTSYCTQLAQYTPPTDRDTKLACACRKSFRVRRPRNSRSLPTGVCRNRPAEQRMSRPASPAACVQMFAVVRRRRRRHLRCIVTAITPVHVRPDPKTRRHTLYVCICGAAARPRISYDHIAPGPAHHESHQKRHAHVFLRAVHPSEELPAPHTTSRDCRRAPTRPNRPTLAGTRRLDASSWDSGGKPRCVAVLEDGRRARAVAAQTPREVLRCSSYSTIVQHSQKPRVGGQHVPRQRRKDRRTDRAASGRSPGARSRAGHQSKTKNTVASGNEAGGRRSVGSRPEKRSRSGV